MMIPYQMIGRLQGIAGRRPWAVRLAILLRNQANCVIRNAFNDSNDIKGNGESRVVRALVRDASVVVDVGANVGDWTAEVLALRPTCHAVLFDPGRVAVQRLVARFGGLPNVEIVPCGLSDREGRMTFFEEPGAGKTSSFAAGFSVAGAEAREVAIGTLDEELRKRGIARVDLLKVDAEGYDMQVLRGAAGLITSQSVDAIQFEYNAPWATSGGTLGEAVRMLSSAGYTVYAVKSAGLFTFDYGAAGEFFGYANFVAVAPRAKPALESLVCGAIP